MANKSGLLHHFSGLPTILILLRRQGDNTENQHFLTSFAAKNNNNNRTVIPTYCPLHNIDRFEYIGHSECPFPNRLGNEFKRNFILITLHKEGFLIFQTGKSHKALK